MRQRVMIAMALTCEPRLLIADEPTTALDVTIQAQILELLKRLVQERDMAMIFVTHDLGVVAGICDRVVVMYAGQVVETADVRRAFGSPQHPYTSVLLEAIPAEHGAGERLVSIPGVVPPAGQMPKGCRFGPRCAHAVPACAESPVSLRSLDGHEVRCIRAHELALHGAALPHEPVP
jgi:peptide/nickel transport system ATP-binding protein